MRLPVVKSCCGCISLTTGAYILGGIAICGSLACMVVSGWQLRQHKDRQPEDNLVDMMSIMNSALAVIFNIVLIVGVRKRLPGHLQVSMLVNVLLAMFGFLIVLVKCLFSTEYDDHDHVCLNLRHVLLGALLATAAVIFCIYYFLIINSLHLHLKRSPLVPTPVPV